MGAYLWLEAPSLLELLHTSNDLLSAEAVRFVSDEARNNDIQDVSDLCLHLSSLLFLAVPCDICFY